MAEVKASEALDRLKEKVLEVDVEMFVNKCIVGTEDYRITPEAKESLLEVWETLVLDTFFGAVNLLGLLGVHFWTPKFPSHFTMLFQFLARGYVLAFLSADEIKSKREEIEHYIGLTGESLDNQGLTFEVDSIKWQAEDVDNPFTPTDRKAEG